MLMSLTGVGSVTALFQNLVLAFPDGRIERTAAVALPDDQAEESAQDARILTPELARVIPPLYSNEKVKDPLVVAKIFNPAFGWTWYVTEGSLTDENGIMMEEGETTTGAPADYMFFGLVKGFEDELGYFSLLEFQAVEEATGFVMERDLYFEPAPLSEIRKSRY